MLPLSLMNTRKLSIVLEDRSRIHGAIYGSLFASNVSRYVSHLGHLLMGIELELGKNFECSASSRSAIPLFMCQRLEMTPLLLSPLFC